MKATCACIQMQFSADISENLDKARGYLREAARNGAEIICLPELATNIFFPFEINDAHFEIAEPIPGPSSDAISACAAEIGAYVIFPLYEHVQAGELYNSAVFIGPKGELVGKYRKNSIPLVHTRESVAIEKYYFRPGNLGFPVFPTHLGITVGITICYDRHFPEGPRSLALAGADVMFVPTASAFGHEIWELELRGHAVANLIWVGGANRVGRDIGGGPARFYGRSLFVSPSGDIVTSTGEEGDEIIYAEIDTDASRELREVWGFYRDRRPDAYGALTEA